MEYAVPRRLTVHLVGRLRVFLGSIAILAEDFNLQVVHSLYNRSPVETTWHCQIYTSIASFSPDKLTYTAATEPSTQDINRAFLEVSPWRTVYLLPLVEKTLGRVASPYRDVLVLGSSNDHSHML